MPKILSSKILEQQHDPLPFPWRLKNIPSCAHSSRMLYHCKKDRLTLADRNSAASAKEIWTLRFKPCKNKILVLSHFDTKQANTFFQPGFQTPKRKKSSNWRCHQIVTIILAWPRQRIEDKLHPKMQVVECEQEAPNSASKILMQQHDLPLFPWKSKLKPIPSYAHSSCKAVTLQES